MSQGTNMISYELLMQMPLSVRDAVLNKLEEYAVTTRQLMHNKEQELVNGALG